MKITCKFCKKENFKKDGFVRKMQRYHCNICDRNFVLGDRRGVGKYSKEIKNLVIKMYLNNCGFRRISAIVNIPLATVFSWVKQAGKIVDEIVKDRAYQKEKIEILEMDELYTYIKKNKTRCEYGLLLIGTDSKMLHLK